VTGIAFEREVKNMLIDRALDEMTKKNKVVVGFDLGNDYSQISYCRQNQSMPDTVSLVMGGGTVQYSHAFVQAK